MTNLGLFSTPFIKSIVRCAEVEHVRKLLGTQVKVYEQTNGTFKMSEGHIVLLQHEYEWDKPKKKELLLLKVQQQTTNIGTGLISVQLFREKNGRDCIQKGVRLLPIDLGSGQKKITLETGSGIILAEDGILKF